MLDNSTWADRKRKPCQDAWLLRTAKANNLHRHGQRSPSNGGIPEPSCALTTDWPDRTDNLSTPKLASSIGRSLLLGPEPLEPAKAMEIAAAQVVAPTVAMVENSLTYLSFSPKASKPHKSNQAALPQDRPRQHCVNLGFQSDAQTECSWRTHHFVSALLVGGYDEGARALDVRILPRVVI